MIQYGLLWIAIGLAVVFIGLCGKGIDGYVNRKLDPLKQVKSWNDGFVSFDTRFGRIYTHDFETMKTVADVLNSAKKEKEGA